MTYALGAVQPFVQDVAEVVGAKFHPAAIYGWRSSAIDMQGHPAGLALDFSVGNDKAKGQQIADYMQANAGAFQVRYLIWQQQVWYPGKSWAPMSTRTGESDPNHLRHVHTSFNAVVTDRRRLGGNSSSFLDTLGTAASWAAPLNPINGALNPLALSKGPLDGLTGVNRIAAALTDRSTWVRVGQVVGGVAAIILGIALLSKDIAVPAVESLAGISPVGRVGKIAKTAISATKSVATPKS